MRLACIDIGTNTTRLLVAEPDGPGLRTVLVERAYASLAHVGREGALGADTIAAVTRAVAEQIAVAKAAGAVSIDVVATAGVRAAGDGPALRAAVAAAGGPSLRLLSGDEEARLAFRGATCRLPQGSSDRVGVLDIGGGSTELAVGCCQSGVDWLVSLPTGSAVLTDELLESDPPAQAELAAARARVEELFTDVAAPPVTAAYAVGGSAGTLYRLVGAVLEADALCRTLERLVEAPSAELAAALGLDVRRARLLPAGIVLLQRAVEAIGVTPRMGSGGVREGVLLERLAAG